MGRRLPSVAELTSFEQRGESFVPGVGSEWADSWNHIENDPKATIVRLNDGVLGAADADGPGGFNYRCVSLRLGG